MDNAMLVLEALAVNPYGVAEHEFADLLATLPKESRDAILSADARALTSALHGRSAMACAIVAPDGDEPIHEPDGNETQSSEL